MRNSGSRSGLMGESSRKQAKSEQPCQYPFSFVKRLLHKYQGPKNSLPRAGIRLQIKSIRPYLQAIRAIMIETSKADSTLYYFFVKKLLPIYPFFNGIRIVILLPKF